MDPSMVEGLSTSGMFSGNPYFSAGFGLIGVGAVLAILRQGARRAADLTRRQILVTLEIPSKDKSYQWVLRWLSQQHQSTELISMNQNTGMKKFIKNATKPRQLAVETLFQQHDNGNVSAEFSFVPGPGKYFFKFQNCWIQADRVRETRMLDLTNGAPWETITLTTLNRDREVFQKILEKAQNQAMELQEGKTVIYTSVGPEWRPFGPPRKKRLLSSVVLDQNLADMIVTDVNGFIHNEQWYEQRGIPYRRGYLLYGPPGTGKTSFIQALAGELGYNICVLNLSERGHTDDRLNHLLTIAPERSIILLEDIDAAFTKNREKTDLSSSSVHLSMITFSGLLNALDGVSSPEERIIFMTTNHIDRLDPALIRPGRVDLKVYLGDATKYQIQTMFNRFYPEYPESLALEFSELLKDYSVSTAQLQGHFVLFKDSPYSALDNIDSLISSLPPPTLKD
ncbi:hypothetical protein BB560_002606 [Smittium megazygosporum]|uniref:Mitochondrial chaperone BCS1 n=1 Tax=Smittium megazygosporum TaxID=133381 RepID=A0A2T9ZEA4_9FUNG|nr:hypothetical protein BB560_002606 [Smittium megazygosporum]